MTVERETCGRPISTNRPVDHIPNWSLSACVLPRGHDGEHRDTPVRGVSETDRIREALDLCERMDADGHADAAITAAREALAALGRRLAKAEEWLHDYGANVVVVRQAFSALERRLAKGAGLAEEQTADYVAQLEALDAERYEAERRLAETEAALLPFAEFYDHNADENGWTNGRSGCQRERIVDWFGPSDFRQAREALRAEPAKEET